MRHPPHEHEWENGGKRRHVKRVSKEKYLYHGMTKPRGSVKVLMPQQYTQRVEERAYRVEERYCGGRGKRRSIEECYASHHNCCKSGRKIM